MRTIADPANRELRHLGVTTNRPSSRPSVVRAVNPRAKVIPMSSNVNAPAVLIVSHERPIRTLIRTTLNTAGYSCVEAVTSIEALQGCAEESFDAVILDLESIELDHADLNERLRMFWPTPLIVLSGQTRELDKATVLDAGADDYVVKPFGKYELPARLRALLRRADATRYGASLEASGDLTCGELKMEVGNRRVSLQGRPLNLTPLQYKLLRILMLHQGKVLTQRFLLEKVWGRQHTDDSNYLRVFISALRRKIEADPSAPKYLLTEKNVGYVLTGAEAG